MPVDRFYLPTSLKPGTEHSLQGAEFQHMTKVLRSKPGDHIELVNGKGQLAHAEIQEILKREALLAIQTVEEQSPPSFQIILAQAIPRMNRLDSIIEKSTELGVDQIFLIPSERSERKSLTDHQLERLQNVSVAAMKQCGRLYLPKIEVKKPLTQWENLDYPAYIGDLDGENSLRNTWMNQKPEEGVIFFIGPESGFSDNEIAHLKELGATGVLLHENILRTDTAPIVALSLIHDALRS